MPRTFLRHASRTIALAAALVSLASAVGAQGAKPLTKCAPDAVVAGTMCIDKYEATVWRVPGPTTINKGRVKKIRAGKATAADLMAGGATQLGVAGDDYAPCADSGQNCANDVYAVSLSGLTPSSRMTWFQAQEACANSGKRLPTSGEWQVGANGTPDPGPDNGTTDCNTTSMTFTLPEDPVSTGSRGGCVSARGAFDMVGNLYEWVADWGPRATTCGAWDVGVSPTSDDQCLAGAATSGEPGALLRGGSFLLGTFVGPLSVRGSNAPSDAESGIGFRCAR